MNPWPRLMQSGGTLAGLGSAHHQGNHHIKAFRHGFRLMNAIFMDIALFLPPRSGVPAVQCCSSPTEVNEHSREDGPHIELVRSTILHPLREGELVLRDHVGVSRSEGPERVK